MKTKLEKLQEAFDYVRFKNKVQTQKEFSEQVGYNEKNISAAFNGNEKYLTDNLFKKICETYPETFNVDYFLSNEGEMLKTDTVIVPFYSVSEFRQKGYAPYYSDLPVAAGQYDLNTIEQKEEPESWLKIPNVYVEIWFPVIGFSMEPKIYAGDTVGVVRLNNWEKVDPDKIYLIITHYDRMIKRLEIDEKNPEIIWAFSENYKKFSIPAQDIVNIYRVVWFGRLI